MRPPLCFWIARQSDMLTDVKLLLIDTCGEVGLVALSDGATLIGEAQLPAREASRALLDMMAKLLAKSAWKLGDLDAVAVVAGPGSFTGVRVGMAAAKGISEATGLRILPVSRLAMLAHAGGSDACAVLDAGRGEYYVRTPDGVESLVTKEALQELVQGRRLLVTEEKVFNALQDFSPEKIEISLQLALPLVMEAQKAEGMDSALADANYVRREQDIYGKAS